MVHVDDAADEPACDWEAFFRGYREPGYVDGFEITSKLGGGVFGDVFRARRMSIGKDYAIKFLKVDDVEVQRAVLAELEQVKYFAQFDHPNLVSIEDRGVVDGIPFLVMSFAGDETLADIVTKGRPPSAAEKAVLLRAFREAARGLQALHERSLVHFDVKPANVFLKGGVARLGDYGLSKLVTQTRGSLSVGGGTPHYMAPELLSRRGDARSDVYSLGVMLYELLCGEVPFHGDSPWEVLRQHETVAPSLPAHLTASEHAALTSCLAKDPAARFQDVGALLSSLDAEGPVASESPLPAGARAGGTPPPLPHERPGARLPSPSMPPPPPAAARSSRRLRGESALFGLCGLAAAMLVVALLFFGGQETLRMARVDSLRLLEDAVVEAKLASPAAADDENDDLPLGRRVARVARRALAEGRRSAERNRPALLQPVDLDRVAAPADLRSYCRLLEPLAAAPVFVPKLAGRVARHGRGACLAAAVMLQELDYSDGLACRRGTNLQRFLSFSCGVDDLVVESAGFEPSARETCMFAAVAGGWRQVVERFAFDEAAYERLLDACGGANEATRR